MTINCDFASAVPKRRHSRLRPGFDVDDDLFYGPVSKGDSQPDDHQDRKNVRPKNGFRLAIKLAEASQHELHERPIAPSLARRGVSSLTFGSRSAIVMGRRRLLIFETPAGQFHEDVFQTRVARGETCQRHVQRLQTFEQRRDALCAVPTTERHSATMIVVDRAHRREPQKIRSGAKTPAEPFGDGSSSVNSIMCSPPKLTISSCGVPSAITLP